MKNVKNSILIAFLFVAFYTQAQEAPEVVFNTIESSVLPEEVSYEYLLANKVYLRDCPEKKCKRRDVLDIGTKLILCEKSERTDTINGVKSNWYKVDTGEIKGWLWGGFIAQQSFGSHKDASIKFVFGREGVTTNNRGVVEEKYQIRAFKNGVELDKLVFASSALNPWEVKNIGKNGMFNVEDIITLHGMASEGKGISTNDLYVFWNNGKLFPVAHLKGSMEAEYSQIEKFIFPSDMEGKRNTIIKRSSITMAVYPLEGPGNAVKRMVTDTLYIWNGYQLLEAEKTPLSLAYEGSN